MNHIAQAMEIDNFRLGFITGSVKAVLSRDSLTRQTLYSKYGFAATEIGFFEKFAAEFETALFSRDLAAQEAIIKNAAEQAYNDKSIADKFIDWFAKLLQASR